MNREDVIRMAREAGGGLSCIAEPLNIRGSSANPNSCALPPLSPLPKMRRVLRCVMDCKMCQRQSRVIAPKISA